MTDICPYISLITDILAKILLITDFTREVNLDTLSSHSDSSEEEIRDSRRSFQSLIVWGKKLFL